MWRFGSFTSLDDRAGQVGFTQLQTYDARLPTRSPANRWSSRETLLNLDQRSPFGARRLFVKSRDVLTRMVPYENAHE